MKTFNRFISEAKEKSCTFTFGRFNPPTTGHELLVKKLMKVGLIALLQENLCLMLLKEDDILILN